MEEKPPAADAPAKDAGGEDEVKCERCGRIEKLLFDQQGEPVFTQCLTCHPIDWERTYLDMKAHADTLEREAAALRGEMARREALLNSEITKLRAISDAMKAQVAVARGLCDKAMQEVRDLIDATPELTAADVEELREGIKAALADGKGEKP